MKKSGDLFSMNPLLWINPVKYNWKNGFSVFATSFEWIHRSGHCFIRSNSLLGNILDAQFHKNVFIEK